MKEKIKIFKSKDPRTNFLWIYHNPYKEYSSFMPTFQDAINRFILDELIYRVKQERKLVTKSNEGITS